MPKTPLTLLNTFIETKSPFPPRPYQKQAIEAFISQKDNHSKFIWDVKTGGGKTFIFQLLTESYPTAKIFMTMPFINLAWQTHAYNTKWGIEQGRTHKNKASLVQLKTLDIMLIRWKNRLIEFDSNTILVVDECHIKATERFEKMIDDLISKGGKLIGMSATPFDGKGNPLQVYKEAYKCVSPLWADINKYFEAGFLTPFYIKKIGQANFDKLNVGIDGDFTLKAQKQALEDTPLDLVDVIIKERGNSTIVICVDIAHATAIYDELKIRGIRAGVVNSKVKNNHLDLFKKGLLDVVCSVNQIAVGTDIPRVDTIILGRIIASWSLIDQILGRSLRLLLEKTIAKIVDAFGSIEKMGRFPFTLPAKEESTSRAKSIFCKECGSKKALILIDTYVEEEEFTRVEVKKCQDCGEVTHSPKMMDIVTCDKCLTTFEIKEVKQVGNDAVTPCECGHNVFLNELTPQEMVVSIQDVDNLKSILSPLVACYKLEQSEADAIYLFATYADSETVGLVMDVILDCTKNYPMASIMETVRKVIARNKIFMLNPNEHHFLKRCHRENIINMAIIKEVESLLAIAGDDGSIEKKLTHAFFDDSKSFYKGELTVVKSYIKRYGIDNTKDIMRAVKGFITRNKNKKLK